MRQTLRIALPLLTLAMLGCPEPAARVTELAHYPLASLDGVISRDGVELDMQVTSDGNGALRFQTDAPRTLRLFETGDLDVENARLSYQARLRAQDLKGQAYLEMWCHFPGQGEYFSRALETPLSGTVEWSTQETQFFLQAGQNPDNVRLNLVIQGQGTVWIDDIRLVQGPLR